jgi:nickel-dependent lactate racemase
MPLLEIPVGASSWSVEIDAAIVTPSRKEEPTALANVAEAVRVSLEAPVRFAAMRRALTPDDRVVLAIDDRLPRLPELIAPVLDHLQSAHVSMENVTLLTPAPGTNQGWIDDLPDEYQDVRTEVHDPKNPQRLAYLATTKSGRRLYLNRTLIDADQIVVLTGRGYDPLFGYAGAEAFLLQNFSNPETLESFGKQLTLDVPDEHPFASRQEATEVAWLLGTPFLIQIIVGRQDSIAGVVSGLLDSTAEGDRKLDDLWRVKVQAPVGAVVATLTGDPSTLTFEDLARAAAAASRIVDSGGKIILLSEIEVQLDEASEMLRRFEEPYEALKRLRQTKPSNMAAAFQWASAADHAKIYLAAHLHWEVAEELFATPIQKPGEVARLLENEPRVALLIDAHKTMAVVE